MKKSGLLRVAAGHLRAEVRETAIRDTTPSVISPAS
jgi:hypothetical protein